MTFPQILFRQELPRQHLKIYFLPFLYYHFFIKFCQPVQWTISPNVPAVTDVWAGIKGLCEAKTARPNVGEGGVGMGYAHDLAD
jgi:hypothetical protein